MEGGIKNGADISIHPPRVGRDQLQQMAQNMANISIHPPRVGRDVSLLPPDRRK